MKLFKAKRRPYRIHEGNARNIDPYPLLRDDDGDEQIWCVSPHHGRSYIVGKTTDGKYIISKGNGLSYTKHPYLHSAEYGDNTWGFLLKEDAIRDFHLGNEISMLGIKTNGMNYVLELENEIMLTNRHTITPVLLQYTVECPYRICDAAYMQRSEIEKHVGRWKLLDRWYCPKSHLIAAHVLINNLRILHTNGILHNAIHPQNYTWALELLDFELSYSPSHPYSHEEDMSRVKDLFNREVIQTYEVINHIAWCLGESIDYDEIDELFLTNGFNLASMNRP